MGILELRRLQAHLLMLRLLPRATLAPLHPRMQTKTKADKGKKVEAAPEPQKPKDEAKPKAKGNTVSPPPPKAGATTPRSAEASRVAKITAAEKAKTPCMFYAYNACKAKQCAFLHSATEKYKGPPPRALSKGKATSKVAASMATVTAGTAAVPLVHAAPLKPSGAIPWLWDTAADRQLIGKQALSPKMKEHLQQSPSRQGVFPSRTRVHCL